MEAHLVIVGLFTTVSFHVYVLTISNFLLINLQKIEKFIHRILVCTQKLRSLNCNALVYIMASYIYQTFSCVHMNTFMYTVRVCTCIYYIRMYV